MNSETYSHETKTGKNSMSLLSVYELKRYDEIMFHRSSIEEIKSKRHAHDCGQLKGPSAKIFMCVIQNPPRFNFFILNLRQKLFLSHTVEINTYPPPEIITSYYNITYTFPMISLSFQTVRWMKPKLQLGHFNQRFLSTLNIAGYE